MRLRTPDSPRALGLVTALLVVACCLAVGLAVHDDGDDTRSSENLAFVDQQATETVLRDTQQIVPQVFSVDAGRVPATRRAARASLIGDAVTQYDKLYGPFLVQARKNGVTLTTSPHSIGVLELSESHGRVLVLADQSASTADGRSTSGAAHLELGVQREDGVWKIASIEVL
ncbi:hypothetical protein [Nocardioides jensenii]|uniref:hypothetical protein n=1 Tax=Nocardioides jensenii TaxID=1843 RepID=UPI00082C30BC|nr:hypothetical protein [Nocardioides jensenii]